MSAKTLLFVALYIWAFWGLFVFTMDIYRAYLQHKLTLASKVLGAPYLIAMLVADVLCNFTIATIVMLETPRELFVTQRLARHIKDGSGWRHAIAAWVCKQLLDPLDPTGHHCEKS